MVVGTEVYSYPIKIRSNLYERGCISARYLKYFAGMQFEIGILFGQLNLLAVFSNASFVARGRDVTFLTVVSSTFLRCDFETLFDKFLDQPWKMR